MDGDVRTARLVLRPPVPDDAAGLFEVFGDPRVWTHYPNLRHGNADQTSAMITSWQRGWTLNGLGVWIVRLPGSERIIGSGGCSMLHGSVWNLGYRIAVEQQGHGFAAELSRVAIEFAASRNPSMPVVAYMVEHNRASVSDPDHPLRATFPDRQPALLLKALVRTLALDAKGGSRRWKPALHGPV